MSDPEQLEIPGADDFNLVGDAATEWEAPPPPDELTEKLPF